MLIVDAYWLIGEVEIHELPRFPNRVPAVSARDLAKMTVGPLQTLQQFLLWPRQP
jgi:hypothetical protein